VPLKHRREMAMAREAKVECQAADVGLARLEPRQRGTHPDPQQVLMNRQAAHRPEHVREMKRRYVERSRQIPDAMPRAWRCVDSRLCGRRQRAATRVLG